MSERNTTTRTYRLDKDVVRRLEALAAQQEAWPSPLVSLLLARALDEIERGAWKLNKTPVKFKATWQRSETGGKLD